MRVLLRQIRPNPFRNIERYPYNEAKIEALRESIRVTGFWDNIVGRLITPVATATADIVIEQAYGHHRMEAMRRESPDGSIEIEMPVRDLSDADMLQIMARENMQEWGTNAWVEIETVRAIVSAYARGHVHLAAPEPTTRRTLIRAAPSFQMGDELESIPPHPYTASTLAPFIGWSADKVRDTLSALELIEAGILDDSDYAGLSTTQAMATTEKAQRIREGARQRAKVAQDASQQASAEADQARRDQEKARQEADEQRRLASEARDRHLADTARKAEDAAKVNYERATEAREAAEASAKARQAEADEIRKQGAAEASEAARDAADQMRHGTSIKEVTRQQPQADPSLDGKCREAAAVLRRILSESDLTRLLQAISQDFSQTSHESRKDLKDALLTLSGAALTWSGSLGVETEYATSERSMETAGV